MCQMQTFWHSMYKERLRAFTNPRYAPINAFPQEGGGGDTLGIRLPNSWQTTLAQGRDLRCFSEKISMKLCLNLKARPGDFGHKIVSHG